MPELHDLLERRASGYGPPADLFERVHDRRRRRDRNRRIRAGVLGVAVLALAAIGFARLLGSEGTPASGPRSPFEGTWVGFDYRGPQTMTIRVSDEGAVRIVVHDDGFVGGTVAADVCHGAPLTITGIGRFQGSTELVIPSPVLTCDDGSDLERFSPSVEETFPKLTFVHHPGSDGLTGGVDDAVWEREGAARTISGGMWPQSSLQEAQVAQVRADDGDPRYTWQLLGLGALTDARQTEFVTRFLQEELGWEEFDVSDFPGLYAGVPQDGLWEMLAVRCAPGQTNPLYPDDPEGKGCAPTIDEYRYETVMINAEPVRVDDPSSIWVVTKWALLQPSDARVTGTNYRDDNGAVFRRQVQQVVPPSDAEATALVDAFLQARVDGEGAEGYLSPSASQVDLLYAATSGAPYERSEFELVRGPVWPGGWREFEVRLFAADGSTVVEQSFLVERDEDGRLVIVYEALDPFTEVLTTENGGALAEPFEFLDGEVTFAAARPWDYSFAGWHFGPFMETLLLENEYEQRFQVHADPRPVETGCRQGPAPADAEALAESILSDPDLEASAPEPVVVGGTTALRIDVAAAPGASVCDSVPAPMVLSDIDLDRGKRMRLYLLDLPEGMSARILAIAISAPEANFEHVVEAAEPIVDSFEFHGG
ncbi:MAG TPA: hypothetical protein VFK59_11400 [Actinomycetota bacterium]|nr:hypothetical protein [Actinomycetota bacterium]